MINSKQFMEFFEAQCGVNFIDIKTGKRSLDSISEQVRENPYNNRNYKSDYDRFLEKTEGGEIDE
jgi:hypothetical protein